MKRQGPRGHWVLLVLSGLVLVVAILLDGAAHGTLGESPRADVEEGGGPEPPESAVSGGPVVNLTDGKVRTARPAERTIALTFDDGPDPKWTPQLLDVLRKHNAHATFFVIGAHVAEHPEIARRMVRAGHEVGSHTYTHIDMTTAPAWRIRLELDLTQRALAGAVGLKTRLMRMPYSSTPQGLTGGQWRAVEQAAGQGYLVALTDRDTEDWAKPGVDKIVERAMAAGQPGEGAVIMLHDSGGDRTATVAAVDQILTRLSAEGYRFTTLSESVGLPYSSTRASTGERLTGKVLVFAQGGSGWLVKGLTVFFALAGVLTLLRLAVTLVLAHVHVRRARSGGNAGTRKRPPPPVSVIVPAYNEEMSIAATVRSLLDTDHPAPIEVIVVDDGSTDDTARIVAELNLPGVRLVRKSNGGKPSALNAGIARARSEVIVLVDGDTVFQQDTIRRLVAPLADPEVGAVSGNAKVANRRGLLGRWQHLEYVLGFNLDRRTFDILGCMPTIPGAIGAFRSGALASVGGVSDDTLAEDTDLTMAISRAGWRVVYEEGAIAWTEAPSSLHQLWRQRYRWCYGTLQAMWKHRRSVVEEGRSGRFGRRCLTHLTFFQVLLPIFAPAMDVFTLYGLAFVDFAWFTGTWLAFTGVQVLAGVYALRLDGESLRTVWALPVQQVVYRQLMYLVVIQSMVTAVLGAPLRWHVIRRTGTFSSDGRSVPAT